MGAHRGQAKHNYNVAARRAAAAPTSIPPPSTASMAYIATGSIPSDRTIDGLGGTLPTRSGDALDLDAEGQPCETRASHSGCGGWREKQRQDNCAPPHQSLFHLWGVTHIIIYTKLCRKHIYIIVRILSPRWREVLAPLRVFFESVIQQLPITTHDMPLTGRGQVRGIITNFMVAHVTSRGSEYCSCGDTESAGGMTRLWPFLLFASQGHPADPRELHCRGAPNALCTARR